MKFYTADLHFHHTNIIRYENRPFDNAEEMNNYLIWKWNQKVSKGDEVYIAGDFAFCSGSEANDLLAQLNGRKFLVKGNHDSFLKDKTFDYNGFVWVKDYAKITDEGQKIILFHYPIAVWDSQHYESYHFYGHVHSNTGTKHPLLLNLGDHAYNVGVDVRDYEPKTFKEIINA